MVKNILFYMFCCEFSIKYYSIFIRYYCIDYYSIIYIYVILGQSQNNILITSRANSKFEIPEINSTCLSVKDS